MTAWSLDGVSLLAHGVHYALVAVGLLGLAWLLAPQVVPGAAGVLPRDDHARRVAALREAVATGRLLTVGPTTVCARPPATLALHLPLALVASAAAAGVHAAMAPAHLRVLPLFGLFFVAATVVHLAWVAAVLHRPSRALLQAGIVLNLGLVGLWLLTRTWGLPLGLMPAPEAVGPWDLAAAAWELVVVAACAALLRAVPPTAYAGLRLPPWVDWHRGATALAALSPVVLLVLTLSGAHG